MAGPLQGIRVIDLTTMVMGPTCTQVLGEYGAEIIKVEPPGGDPMRHVGPSRHPGMGPLFLAVNRNKRSVVLDLKQPADLGALMGLLQTADVFVTNTRQASLQRLGLDAKALSERMPGLIHVVAQGFGSDGPYGARPAYDDMIQAQSGIAGLFTLTQGEPKLLPMNLSDRYTGLQLANVVLAALFERQRSGLGQAIELPMFECMVQLVMADHLGGHSVEPPSGPMGYARLVAPQRKPFQTADGYLCAPIYTDDHWRRFLAFAGEADLMQRDARFASVDARVRNADTVQPWIAAHMLRRTTGEWLATLEALDIPAAAVNSLEALLDDEHLKAVGFFELHAHPTEGTVRSTRHPARWSRTQPVTTSLAPVLGEANAQLDSLMQRGTRIEDVGPDA
jgi:crotonobetainyl-CoA:carnitine CoA-transferase CaiB-like acyl-CoA transferase